MDVKDSRTSRSNSFSSENKPQNEQQFEQQKQQHDSDASMVSSPAPSRRSSTVGSMSLRPRGALKPPSRISDIGADECYTTQNDIMQNHLRQRKRQQSVIQNVKNETPILANKRELSEQPTCKKLKETEPLVTRAMFVMAAELALKIHNEHISKQQRKHKNNKSGAALIDISKGNMKENILTATTRIVRQQPQNSSINSFASSSTSKQENSDRLLAQQQFNINNSNYAGNQMGAIKVATPRSVNVNNSSGPLNRNLQAFRVVLPRILPKTPPCVMPRQVFPLQAHSSGSTTSSNIMSNENGNGSTFFEDNNSYRNTNRNLSEESNNSFDHNGIDAQRDSSYSVENSSNGVATATVTVSAELCTDNRRILLDSVLSRCTVELEKEPRPSFDNSAERLLVTCIKEETDDILEYRNLSQSTSAGKKDSTKELNIVSNVEKNALTADNTAADSTAADSTNVEELKSSAEVHKAALLAAVSSLCTRSRSGRVIRPTQNKRSFDLEQVRRQVTRGELLLQPIGNGSTVESHFFVSISCVGGAPTGFVKCKFCGGIFSNHYIGHVKTCHTELFNLFSNNGKSKNGVDANKAQKPESSLQCREEILKNAPHSIQTLDHQITPARKKSTEDGIVKEKTRQQESLKATSKQNKEDNIIDEQSEHVEKVAEPKKTTDNSPTKGSAKNANKQGSTSLIVGLKVSTLEIPPVANLFNFVSLLQSRPHILAVLLEYGLLQNSQRCAGCKCWMKVKVTQKSIDGYLWTCKSKYHKEEFTRLVRYDSFFGAVFPESMNFLQALTFVYMWARECTDEQIANELSVSPITTQHISHRFRELCFNYCDKQLPLFGGLDVVVEIDVLSVSSTHFICAVDCQSGAVLFFRVPFNQSLSSIVKERIAAGSLLYLRDRPYLRLLDSSDYTCHIATGPTETIGFSHRLVRMRPITNGNYKIAAHVADFWTQLRDLWLMCERNPNRCALYVAELVLRQNALIEEMPVFNYFMKFVQLNYSC